MNFYTKQQRMIDQDIHSCNEHVETWKADYENAQRVYNCQDFIRVALAILNTVDRLDKASCEDLASGNQEYDEETDEAMKRLWRTWLQMANALMGLAAQWKARSYTVDHEPELAAAIKYVEALQQNNFEQNALELLEKNRFDSTAFRECTIPDSFWGE